MRCILMSHSCWCYSSPPYCPNFFLICLFLDGRRLLSPAALSLHKCLHRSMFALIHVHMCVFVCARVLLEAGKLLIHSQQRQITCNSLIRKCGRQLKYISVPLFTTVWPGKILYFTRQHGFSLREHNIMFLMHCQVASAILNCRFKFSNLTINRKTYKLLGIVAPT